MANQTPLEEIQERVAETVPGLSAAAHMVGLEDHRRMLADNARRVRDSHRYQMECSATGGEQDRKGDDMGHLIVTGDIYGDRAVQSLEGICGKQSQPQVQKPVAQPTEKQKQKQLSKLAKAGIVAALLAGGAGGGAAIPLIADAMKPDQAATTPAADTWIEYDIEKWQPDAP